MEFFKHSRWEQHDLLLQQCERLAVLERTHMAARDEKWLAQRDFSLLIARDIVKAALPAESSLSKKLSSLADHAPTLNPLVIDSYELQLLKLAAERINWAGPQSETSVPGLESSYTRLDHMLPQLVFRHWAFRVIIALLTALAVFAATGVIKYNNLTVDIDQKIRDKEKSLDARFEQQRQRIDASLNNRERESEQLGSQLKVLTEKSAYIDTQLDQLQKKAQRSVDKFVADASLIISSQAEKEIPKLREGLDREYGAALNAVKSEGNKRVAQVLALDGGAGFAAKIQEFDQRSAKAIGDLNAFELRAKKLGGQIDALQRTARLVTPDGTRAPVIEQLAAYFNMAVYWVYGLGIVLSLMLVVNVLLLISWMRR